MIGINLLVALLGGTFHVVDLRIQRTLECDVLAPELLPGIGHGDPNLVPFRRARIGLGLKFNAL